jgi:hypothetical protein
MKHKTMRSTLPKPEARQRYIAIAELVALEQIRQDSRLLDEDMIAVGPFARLDAGAVAAHDGKTRGSITNLFGSQAAFQAETMALALSASALIDDIEYPSPVDFPNSDAWIDAFFATQSARGPLHGARPVVNYASLWALWLSALPYGLWSEQIARPSLEEHVIWVRQLEGVFTRALDHYRLTLRAGTTVNDLACAAASLIEGVWLNQCLTTSHPCEPSEPISTVLRRAGRLLWLGATGPAVG